MKLFQFVIIFAISNLCYADFAVNGEYISPASKASQFQPFPKKLWAFWESGLQNSKLWTKLCINNMNYYSKKSGFEFYFLTKQNYTKYLSPESNKKFEYLINNQKNLGAPQRASILRGFLMYEHGGIWADAHTILTSDFSWVENLYKYSGVYNRFHPNPEVVFFTKNKNYSGNKTKLYDQKRQQQVYLFPGMQNWFLIAKPKSKFYTDLINSFERYVRIGRAQILKDSMRKGIMFEGEKAVYFRFGSFQLQLVIQNKQKQLDKMTNQHLKYAVEYYKMWNIHSEYSGFIMQAHLERSQQVAFHFQYGQQSLSKLYNFNISTPFIKDIGGISRQLQKSFGMLSLNMTCHNVSNIVQKDSFVYKHLINIPSMFEEINQMHKVYSFFQGKCNPLAQAVDDLKKSLFILKILIIGTLLGVSIYTINHIWYRMQRQDKGFRKLSQ